MVPVKKSPKGESFGGPGGTGGAFNEVLGCVNGGGMLLLIIFISLILDAIYDVNTSCYLGPVLGSITSSIGTNGFTDSNIDALVGGLTHLSTLCVNTSLFAFVRDGVVIGITCGAAGLLHGSLFSRVRALPLHCFSSRARNRVVDHFAGSISGIRVVLRRSVIRLISSTFAFIKVITVVVILDPVLFNFTLVFLIIVVVIISRVNGRSEGCFETRRGGLKTVGNGVRRSVRNVGIVGIFGRRRRTVTSFARAGRGFHGTTAGTGFFSNVVNPYSANVGGTDCTAVTLINNVLTLSNGLSVNAFFAFLDCSGRFARPVGRVTGRVGAIFSTLTNTRHIFRVVSVSPRISRNAIALRRGLRGNREGLF